jgi:outer membrane scaffolding protein for murein synthesis (MipA/OmpV family)
MDAARLWCVVAAAFAMMRTDSALADDAKRNWDLAIGIGATYSPEYSGSRAASGRLQLWADGSYRTEGFGTIALDSGSLTIAPEARWDFVDSMDAGIGVLVGYRAGRNDSKPRLIGAEDGSPYLNGLPSVSSSLDAGVAAHLTILGLPLFAQIRSATGGAQGTLMNVGAYIPLKPQPDLEMTVLPTVTYSNARQMRAFYGVSSAASLNSGFAPYDPGAGWENAAIEISGDWHLSGGLHLIVSMAYQRLLGNAAASPIVQTPNQPSALVGIAVDF